MGMSLGLLISSLILDGLPWYPTCYLFPDCILHPAASFLDSVGRSASVLNCLPHKMFPLVLPGLAALDTEMQHVPPRSRSHCWAESPKPMELWKGTWAQMCSLAPILLPLDKMRTPFSIPPLPTFIRSNNQQPCGIWCLVIFFPIFWYFFLFFLFLWHLNGCTVGGCFIWFYLRYSRCGSQNFEWSWKRP